jgi:hypothetical protein
VLTDADRAFMTRMTDLAAPLAEDTIIYLRYAGIQTGDRAAGVPERPVYDPPNGTALSAVVNTADIANEDLTGGRVLIGDVVFQIRLSVLSDEPSRDDRIKWANGIYEPIRIQDARAGASLFWVVRCRRI